MKIGDLLKNRIQAPNLEEKILRDTKDYQLKFRDAVNEFVKVINKELAQEGKPPLPFIAIRMKLIALKEIDDLRVFYKHCRYKGNGRINGVRYTFKRAFFERTKKIIHVEEK